MRTLKIIFTSNPVDEFWDNLLPTRIGKYDLWLDINPEPIILEVPETELSKTLYNLLDYGSSFVIKY